MKRRTRLCTLLVLIAALAACQPQPEIEPGFDPSTMRFSGDRALEIESDFVTRFPKRHSGQPNNRLAAEWLLGEVTAMGWDCTMDQWPVILYSRPVMLQSTVCRLTGDSEREILVMAHHDQASTTIEGADNDGSGVAILYHLAEIFAEESPLPYTLAFVFADAEEYGMIGSRRYVATHPNVENIIAGISLDNLGRYYYDGMSMELIGQYDSYGPIWLALAARTAAAEAGLWEVHLRAPLDQVTDQAAPTSFMDQGPIVAMGIPALGLAGHVPPEFVDEHYRLWHDPDDDLSRQSAEILGMSGLTVEALIRQLLSMKAFPQEQPPYLYFEGSNQVLRGWPLWTGFVVFIGLFFAGSLAGGKTSLKDRTAGWSAAAPHLLALWLPLLGSVLLLYLLTSIGMMEKFEAYPATAKDPYVLNPRWPAVIAYLVGLAALFALGRRLERSWYRTHPAPSFLQLKSLAIFVVGTAALVILFRNAFSLLFFFPLLFWLAIGGRNGPGKIVDVLFFLLGGLVLYALIYIFGFLTLRYDFAFLWFLLNFFSVGMISFWMAALITAVVGAGLALVVRMPVKETT